MTYSASPTVKYILQVHTVTIGNTASQIDITTTSRMENTMVKKACSTTFRKSRKTGNLGGMFSA